MKIIAESKNGRKEADLYTPEGLELINELWTRAGFHHRVMYQPTWLGIPIIQFPGDMVMLQELVWKIRPELIIETGVAHGGTSILFASIMELLGKGKVLAIDIEIRQHNRLAIQSHPLSHRIELVEGSSIAPDIVAKAAEEARGKKTLVVLDSNHTYEHVREEIARYADLVSKDSYLVVMDGVQKLLATAPTGKPEWEEDNPLRAIEEFLAANPDTWVNDPWYERVGPTCTPLGFLRKIEE